MNVNAHAQNSCENQLLVWGHKHQPTKQTNNSWLEKPALVKNGPIPSVVEVTRWLSWLRQFATSRNVPVSIPEGVIWDFSLT
jgi:hypothetical protein